jgi:hypothetical protein
MYGFLILLPLTLISLLIGYFVAGSPQVGDYAEYLSDFANQEISLGALRTNTLVWVQLASHLLAYTILCFALIGTVRTISAPLPSDRPAGLRFFQLFLEVVFVSLPSTVFLWIVGKGLLADWDNWILWAAAAVLCIGLLTTIAVTAGRRQLELYGSFGEPFRVTITDIVVALVVLLTVATVAGFAFYPRESARAVGTFPLLMLGTAILLLLVAAVFSRHSSPVAIISSLITIVLVLHVVDQVALPGREFRYRKVELPAGSKKKLTPQEIKERRKIPDLRTAFHQWLEHRRPAIEEYAKKGRAYPVFFVSAQGGGIYAAYHPALSLARLTDYCPEFAHHLFGISAISGGSLGSAVFAELMRQVPPQERGTPARTAAGCSRLDNPMAFTFLQKNVQAFFGADFLSPMVASALLFDVPSFFIPQLRFGNDRAKALEWGFETAWQNLKLPDSGRGLSADFYERWDPTGPAPALFLSTTGVNFGIPVVVSQIDWSFNPSRGLSTRRLKRKVQTEVVAREGTLLETILDRLRRPDDQLQVGTANLLDFRPDVQINVSTAVGLSARFPFVTPPATIRRNDQIEIPRGTIFQRIKELELTDGSFNDNSGSTAARDIINDLNRGLDSDERLKPFKNSIQFHLIRFTDTPARRQALASEGAHFELVTPFAAYDAVRLSRGVFPANPPRTRVSNVYLLDEWYEGSLNWLLSRATKVNIEKRASWIPFGNEVCCEVRHPSVPDEVKRIPLSEKQVMDLQSADGTLSLKNFIPNADDFLRVMRLVNEGVRVDNPATGAPPAPPAKQ